MPWAIQQLLARGYWEQAGEGSDGSSGDVGGSTETADQAKEAESKVGDKPGPTEAEAKLLKEVMEKKGKIREREQRIAELERTLEKYSTVNLDEVQQLLKDREEAEKAKLEAKGEWETLKKRQAEEYAKEKETLAKAISDLTAQLEARAATINRLTVEQNFDNSSFITKETVLTPRKARVIYGPHFDIQEDGTVVGYDKPRGEAGRAQLIGSDGNPLPFEEAIKRVIEGDPDRDEILRSRRRQGAGSGTEGGKPTTQVRAMSAIDKIATGLANSRKK